MLGADGIPIVIRVWKRKEFVPGPYKLGAWQLPINLAAIAWVLTSTVRRSLLSSSAGVLTHMLHACWMYASVVDALMSGQQKCTSHPIGVCACLLCAVEAPSMQASSQSVRSGSQYVLSSAG